MLAHYYIWWDPAAWNRVKDDSPQAGRYSSDDATIVRTQIQRRPKRPASTVSWSAERTPHSRTAGCDNW